MRVASLAANVIKTDTADRAVSLKEGKRIQDE